MTRWTFDVTVPAFTTTPLPHISTRRVVVTWEGWVASALSHKVHTTVLLRQVVLVLVLLAYCQQVLVYQNTTDTNIWHRQRKEEDTRIVAKRKLSVLTPTTLAGRAQVLRRSGTGIKALPRGKAHKTQLLKIPGLTLVPISHPVKTPTGN